MKMDIAEGLLLFGALTGYGLLAAWTAIVFGPMTLFVSGGLFLISLAGVRNILTIAWVGLYELIWFDRGDDEPDMLQ